jgi:hypothetical protein
MDVRENEMATSRPRTDWAAIWGGVFTFFAIWSVFGFLALAIFGSAANPTNSSAATGISVGMGIWAVVLTIIAMYVAGLETGKLATVASRHDGLVHGMIMFGLAVVATIVITVIAGNGLAAATGAGETAHNAYLLDVFKGQGWVGFIALFLGWLAAMGGASMGASRKVEGARNVREIRPAA